MYSDSILEEIWAYREEFAKRFNYDMEAIARHFNDEAKRKGLKLVSLPPRRVEPISASPVVVAPGES